MSTVQGVTAVRLDSPLAPSPTSTWRTAAARRTVRRRGDGSQLGSIALVLGGAVSLQFGAAIAALLFPRAGAMGVVFLRLALAAVVMLLICRPRIRGYSPGDWALVTTFGVALAGLNSLFYQAIERIPLGAAVTLEVLGPLTLSVLAARRKASLFWAALALAGVFLLGRGGFDSLNVEGVLFALAAGVLWALYILLSARTGRHFPKADGLAIALAIGAVLSLPFGIASAGSALLDPVTLGLGAAVALLSSMLPYTLELLALRRIAAATFAVLMSLEPAIAAFAGFLVLSQALSVLEGLGMALVIIASIGAVRLSRSARSSGSGTRDPEDHGQPAVPPNGAVL